MRWAEPFWVGLLRSSTGLLSCQYASPRVTSQVTLVLPMLEWLPMTFTASVKESEVTWFIWNNEWGILRKTSAICQLFHTCETNSQTTSDMALCESSYDCVQVKCSLRCCGFFKKVPFPSPNSWSWIRWLYIFHFIIVLDSDESPPHWHHLILEHTMLCMRAQEWGPCSSSGMES